MKRVLSVLFLIIGLVSSMFAFEPGPTDGIIKKPSKDKYAIIYFPQYSSAIYDDFVFIHLMYKNKHTNSEMEKNLNKRVPFYEETNTAEEYILKIYEYLNKVPYYWGVCDMTETELANREGFKGEGNLDGTFGKVWIKEYSNVTIKGDGEGCFSIKFKK